MSRWQIALHRIEKLFIVGQLLYLTVLVATKRCQCPQHVAQHLLTNNFSRSVAAKFLFPITKRYSPTHKHTFMTTRAHSQCHCEQINIIRIYSFEFIFFNTYQSLVNICELVVYRFDFPLSWFKKRNFKPQVFLLFALQLSFSHALFRPCT